MQPDQGTGPEGRGWGQEWAPATWVTAPQSAPADDAPTADPAAPAPAPASPEGVSDTLERGFAVLRRSPMTVFTGGAMLGLMVLLAEVAGYLVTRAWALRLLMTDVAPGDPVTLAPLDGAGVTAAALSLGLVGVLAWLVVVSARSVVDGLVAVAVTSPDGRVGVRQALGRTRERLRLLVGGGLLVAALGLPAVLVPVAAPALGLVHPVLGLLATLTAAALAVGLLLWLWGRSALLGAALMVDPTPVRAAGVRDGWRRAGHAFSRAPGSAVLLLVLGAVLAIAVGGTASAPLHYLSGFAVQPTVQDDPLFWLGRTWWQDIPLEVPVTAAAHAVATTVGYPLFSVISALIWAGRAEQTSTAG